MAKIIKPSINAAGSRINKKMAKVKQVIATIIGKQGKKGALNGRSNSFLLYLKYTAAKLTNANPTKYIKLVTPAVNPIPAYIPAKTVNPIAIIVVKIKQQIGTSEFLLFFKKVLGT